MTTRNTSTKVTSIAEGNYSDSFRVTSIFCLIFAALIGFVGNGLILAVMSRMKKLRSVMNRFILHLAVSDILVSAICLPLFVAINFFSQEGKDGVWTCKIARFLQYLAPEASMSLLITIGLNRHRALVHPLNMMTYSTANKLIVAAWLYALAIVAPSIHLTEVKFYIDASTNSSRPYCATIPVSTLQGRIYVLFLGVFGYLIPLTVLISLYARICCVVWRRGDKVRASRPMAAMLKTRKKVIKMFLTVIIVFTVTWTPMLLYVGFLEGLLYKTARRIDEVRLVLYAIGLSNSICNPFIYSFFNARFREGCKGIFKASARMIKHPRESFRMMKRWNKGGFSPSAEMQATAEASAERSSNVLTRQGGLRKTLDTDGHDSKTNSNDIGLAGDSFVIQTDDKDVEKSGTEWPGGTLNTVDKQQRHDAQKAIDPSNILITLSGISEDTKPETDIWESSATVNCEKLMIASNHAPKTGLLKALSLDSSSRRRSLFRKKDSRKARSVSDDRNTPSDFPFMLEFYGQDMDEFDCVF